MYRTSRAVSALVPAGALVRVRRYATLRSVPSPRPRRRSLYQRWHGRRMTLFGVLFLASVTRWAIYSVLLVLLWFVLPLWLTVLDVR